VGAGAAGPEVGSPLDPGAVEGVVGDERVGPGGVGGGVAEGREGMRICLSARRYGSNDFTPFSKNLFAPTKKHQ